MYVRDVMSLVVTCSGKDKNVKGERRHNKGCNCKRSGCLKNYCECYEVSRTNLKS